MKQKYLFKKMFYLPAKYLLMFISIAMLFVCSEVSAKASAVDVHEVADLCMYASRSLKDYALIGMGVDYNDPKAELKETLGLADEHFKDLKSHKMNKKLTDEILELETSWNAMKPVFEKDPDKKKMSELHHKVEKYVTRCEKIAEDLSKDTGIKGEHYVVLISELGMESQWMAVEYLTQAWGVEDADHDKEVKEVLNEVHRIFTELMEADEKLVSKKIKSQLKDCEKDFTAFGIILKSKSGRFMPSAAEKSASKIYDKIKEILKMEKKLVEGSVSGYFTPVADEKSTEQTVRTISNISSLNKKEMGS